MNMVARGGLAALLALLLAGTAAAATISEQALGDFSGNFAAPTVIGNGATSVTGIWSADPDDDYDILAFTDLRSGAQTVTLSFAPLSPIGPRDYSFSAGGAVNYLTTPFEYSAWEGTRLVDVGIFHRNRGNSFDYVINLGEDFAGDLYLGLLGTYGTLQYTIFAEGNAAPTVSPSLPAVVPLPGALPLLAAGLGSLALLRRRRRV